MAVGIRFRRSVGKRSPDFLAPCYRLYFLKWQANPCQEQPERTCSTWEVWKGSRCFGFIVIGVFASSICAFGRALTCPFPAREIIPPSAYRSPETFAVGEIWRGHRDGGSNYSLLAAGLLFSLVWHVPFHKRFAAHCESKQWQMLPGLCILLCTKS
jgi:hypothetical protein